jgi:hypothetical protein
MSRFPLTVLAFGLLLSPAFAQEEWSKDELAAGVKRLEYTRQALPGKKMSFAFLYAVNPDCSIIDGHEAKVTKKPEHGAVEIVPVDRFPMYAKDNPRFKCNEKKTRGLNVNYKSSDGYKGPDAFEFFDMLPTGATREFIYNINVR